MVDFGQTYSTVFVETKLNPYCRIINVVDLESGEVLLSKTAGNIQGAFANGYNACAGEVVISRELSGGGSEYRIVTDKADGETVYCRGWYGRGKNQKKRVGGQKSYLKLYPDKLLALPANTALAVLQLSRYVNAAGCLKLRGRHNPLDIAGIASLLDVEKKQCYKLLQEMKTWGVLSKAEGAYYLNKDYIGRG